MGMATQGFAHAPVQELRQAFGRPGAPGEEAPPNPALQIDVLGVRRWRGNWLAVVVTPHAAQLVILPGYGEVAEPMQDSGTATWYFPAGGVNFSVRQLQDVGLCHVAAVLDSVAHFDSHDAAARAALGMLERLLDPSAAPPTDAPAQDASTPAGPVSRRDFIRGRFFGR